LLPDGWCKETWSRDLRSLTLLNRELDRNTDCKAIAEFHQKEKERIGTTEESTGPSSGGTEALIFVQGAVYKL
jgi:hypothetical protein